MLHSLIIACLLVLFTAAIGWYLLQRRFLKAIARVQPPLAEQWQALGSGYQAALNFCRRGLHRADDQTELHRAGDSLLLAHKILMPLFAGLIILMALLIIFSSDPGNPDDYQFWP